MQQTIGCDEMVDFALKLLSTERLPEQILEKKLQAAFEKDDACLEKVNRTLTYLKKMQILDDSRTAQQVVLRHWAKGDRLIRDRLRAKQLTTEVIDLALLRLEPELMRARHIVQEQYDQQLQNHAQVKQMLLSRGFSLTVCQQVLMEAGLPSWTVN